MTLEQLRKEVLQCNLCGLSKTRTNVVFGAGSPTAKVVVVGEAPGAAEDQQALPFIGTSGKILRETLCGVGFHVSHIFIVNMLKCRPPGNRDPSPEELNCCIPWLEKQLEILNPSILITPGRFSTAYALQKPLEAIKITQMSGKLYEVGTRLVAPLVHPAFVQRGGLTREGYLIAAARVAKEAKAMGLECIS